METILNILRSHVELAIFLTLALGFLLGRIKIGNFKLGVMLGTLFAGIIIGQLNIPISPAIKIIFFDLFLFATGYKVGPQFFYGLKKDALPQLALTVVICVACLFTAFLAAKIMGYDVGTASGLLAGAFTESTVIGTASDAIMNLPISDTEKANFVNNIPVAYAVTYLIGTTALVWFLSSAGPRLMRVDLRKEAEKLATAMQMKSETHAGVNSAYEEWLIRSFSLENKNWSGLSVAEFEKMIPGTRIIVERIRKNGEIVEPHPGVKMDLGDTVVIAARQHIMLNHLHTIGLELHDKELLDFPMINMDVVVSKKEIDGKSLAELADKYGQGIMLESLIRAGLEMPFEPGTIVNMGDVLKIYGRDMDVKRVAVELGFENSIAADTDVIAVAGGIVLGGLVGMLNFKVGGIAFTLSISGGALLLGLVFGWFHSRMPRFGRIPEPALWIFDTMGLATFLGLVGIAAGPTFISGLQKTGFGLLAVGVIVSVVPHLLGLLFGRYVLKMNPLVLLGAHSGAGTNTTALKAIQDASGSKIPVLGYTIPYALGNILLTAWGPVMVSMMT